MYNITKYTILTFVKTLLGHVPILHFFRHLQIPGFLSVELRRDETLFGKIGVYYTSL
jgi:hypothetical protein